jgi:hypothetical protein
MERRKCSIRWLENLAKVRFEAGAGPTGFRQQKCSPGARTCRVSCQVASTIPWGARALYLGSTLYRIHGSNEPETIGQAVSSGCFRMTNDDVIDLYNRVSVGATVIVR